MAELRWVRGLLVRHDGVGIDVLLGAEHEEEHHPADGRNEDPADQPVDEQREIAEASVMPLDTRPGTSTASTTSSHKGILTVSVGVPEKTAPAEKHITVQTTQ
jgi:hypothetical protein